MEKNKGDGQRAGYAASSVSDESDMQASCAGGGVCGALASCAATSGAAAHAFWRVMLPRSCESCCSKSMMSVVTRLVDAFIVCVVVGACRGSEGDGPATARKRLCTCWCGMHMRAGCRVETSLWASYSGWRVVPSRPHCRRLEAQQTHPNLGD